MARAGRNGNGRERCNSKAPGRWSCWGRIGWRGPLADYLRTAVGRAYSDPHRYTRTTSERSNLASRVNHTSTSRNSLALDGSDGRMGDTEPSGSAVAGVG